MTKKQHFENFVGALIFALFLALADILVNEI